MSGKRQHILPRFLLKGFASRVEGDEVFAYCYRLDSEPFEANIKNIGVGTYFYGKEGKMTADEELTKAEGPFSVLVNKLRQMADGAEIANTEIVDFVVHLSSRTKHLRDGVIESSSLMMDKVMSFLADERKLREWTIGLYSRNPEMFMQALMEDLESAALKVIPGADADMLALMRHTVADVFPIVFGSMGEGDMAEIAETMGATGQQFASLLPGMIKEAHIKTLAKDLVAAPRADLYRHLAWRLHHLPSPIVLSDAGCLFEVVGKSGLRSLAGEGDEIKRILLPVSKNRLAIGSADQEYANPKPSLLNVDFVEASREFFISNEKTDDLQTIKGRLGSNAELISEEELQTIVLDGFEEASFD